MRKKRWEKNKRITIRRDIDKGILLAACSQRMEAKYSARKRLRKRVKIIHRADYATAALVIEMRNRIDVAFKNRAIAMSDQFHLDFARYERLVAKPVEHEG